MTSTSEPEQKCDPAIGYHVVVEGDTCQCGERSRMVKPEAPATDLMGCARCGEDHPIRFKPFREPMVVGEHVLTHWGMCRNTDEPVLMRFVEPE